MLIEDAKWCGKTTTAEQIAKSRLYMSEIGMVEQNIRPSAESDMRQADGFLKNMMI